MEYDKSQTQGTEIMDATTALQQSDELLSALIAGLTPDHRELRTPCDQWNVHELVEHVVEGTHGIAGGLTGAAPPEETPDFMANGPANAWRLAVAHLSTVATPEVLSAMHQMPFGEVPGEAAVSVIVADQVTHAWDLAKATDQPFAPSEELAQFALSTWQPLVPAQGRTGDGFKAVIEISDDAPVVDRLVAYTGRQP